jgi:hypothetical protein
MVDCIRTGEAPLCGIEASAAQTALVCAAQESAVEIGGFPKSSVMMQARELGTLRWVQQLEAQLTVCYESMRLPTEAGFSWGKPGNPIKVELPAVFSVSGAVNGNHNGNGHAPKITTSVFVTKPRQRLTEPT